ncbi:MFS transporter [Streptomyces sp. RKND-216]|uniref:MFS transporter n=1 Tax=Streptomyces sp. RKND-216 TaxID=2562581 RepID=UPI00109DACCE|nr:MFS transporter [Streptomyces sp. RKND-216]THA24367.1 MFS transporter [Streptomyces sp. RKND-216]
MTGAPGREGGGAPKAGRGRGGGLLARRRPSPSPGRPFHALVVSNAVSSYGTYLNLVALNLYVLETSSSALSLGLFLLLRIASSVLSGYVAGRIVVRFDRVRLMIGADLCQASALLVFLMAPGTAQTVLLYVLAAVMGGGSTLTGVARRHTVPDLVGQELRVRANGLLVTGRSLAMVLGFASAGLVVAQAGYTAAFLVDAASFLASALALTALALSGAVPGARTRDPADGGPSESGGDRGGADRGRAARERPGARNPASPSALWRFAPAVLCLILVRAVDNMGSAAHQVGLPVYAEQIAPGDAAAFVGRFYAVWAVGCLLAHQLVSRLRAVSRWAGGSDASGRPGGERAFAVGTCLMSGFFILAFADLPAVALMGVAIAAGVADGFTEIVYHSRLQALPEVQRGRLLGLAAMAETGALGAGTVLWASLLDHHTPLSVVATAHGLAIALALLFLLALRRLPPPAVPTEGPEGAGGTHGTDGTDGTDAGDAVDPAEAEDGGTAGVPAERPRPAVKKAPTSGPADWPADPPPRKRERWTPTT